MTQNTAAPRATRLWHDHGTSADRAFLEIVVGLRSLVERVGGRLDVHLSPGGEVEKFDQFGMRPSVGGLDADLVDLNRA